MSARCCIFAVLIGADAAVSLRLAQPGLRAPRLASPLRMMSGDDFYFGESDVKVSASTTEAVEVPLSPAWDRSSAAAPASAAAGASDPALPLVHRPRSGRPLSPAPHGSRPAPRRRPALRLAASARRRRRSAS